MEAESSLFHATSNGLGSSIRVIRRWEKKEREREKKKKKKKKGRRREEEKGKRVDARCCVD